MFVKRVAAPWAVAVAAVLAFSGCATAPDATDGRLQVAAAFYPFGYVAARVGGDQVRVTNLTQPGSEPHDLELTPRQVAAIASADLVVVQSGFQPAVDAALAEVTPAQTVDAATFLDFLTAGEEDGHDHGGDRTSGSPDAGAHKEPGANPSDSGADEALDPHTWLDPTNLVAVAEQVRDALTRARPEAAASFAANTKALAAELTSLDADFSTELAQCERRTFITSHSAFGYLAHRYDLVQVGIRGLAPDVEPTASRIAEVQQLAREQGVTTIFFETLVSPVVAASIASDLGLVTDVLDPLEGITADSRGTDYPSVMRANLAALKKANEC